jgi:gluconolactonase
MVPRLAGLVCLSALALIAQDDQGGSIQRVVSNYAFTDGPAWSHEGFLLFSDSPSNRIMKIDSEGVTVFRSDSGGTTGNAVDEKGRVYSCESTARRVVRFEKKGKVDVLAESWQGKKLNGPNDLTISKAGHVYFTDPAFGKQLDSRELDFNGVYHITPKGELSLVAKYASRPGGITLSPNGKLLYVTNADEKNVRVYDIDKNGAPVNERILIQNIDGIPGGLRTDEKGSLYIAAKGVSVYKPDGSPVNVIPMPEKPANLSFGNSDLQTLYVTAKTSVYRVHLDVKGSSGN